MSKTITDETDKNIIVISENTLTLERSIDLKYRPEKTLKNSIAEVMRTVKSMYNSAVIFGLAFLNRKKKAARKERLCMPCDAALNAGLKSASPKEIMLIPLYIRAWSRSKNETNAIAMLIKRKKLFFEIL